MTDAARILEPFVEGWLGYQRLLLGAIGPLTDEQLASRTAPFQWAVWQLAAHVAGSRAYWFHDVLGEGDPATREMFRVQATTVPGVSLEDAGWEDDEDHPRSAAELTDAFERTWTMLDEAVRRWTAEDLEEPFTRIRWNGEVQTFTRAWVVWHLIEHDLHHGGEISQILGTNGIPSLEL
ncbi:MAG TPA: DinB family protein [Actinomycetota bacterium]|nr:DinB family protein [Actinomycetota bacterium]